MKILQQEAWQKYSNVAIQILTNSILASPLYLVRNCDPRIIMPALEAFDREALLTATTLLRIPRPSDIVIQFIRLPRALGGLGVKSIADSAETIYALAQKNKPARDAIGAKQVKQYEELVANLQSIEQRYPEHSVQKVQSQIMQRNLAPFRPMAPNVERNLSARLLFEGPSLQGAAFLTAIHDRMGIITNSLKQVVTLPGNHVTEEVFLDCQLCKKKLYGLSAAEHHLTCSHLQPMLTQKHHAVNNAICTIARAAKGVTDVKKENVIVHANSGTRGTSGYEEGARRSDFDLQMINGTGFTRVLGDVHITSKALIEGIRLKNSDYAALETPFQYSFVPFVITTRFEIAKPAEAFYRALASRFQLNVFGSRCNVNTTALLGELLAIVALSQHSAKCRMLNVSPEDPDFILFTPTVRGSTTNTPILPQAVVRQKAVVTVDQDDRQSKKSRPEIGNSPPSATSRSPVNASPQTDSSSPNSYEAVEDDETDYPNPFIAVDTQDAD
jgi:hypothetical protein